MSVLLSLWEIFIYRWVPAYPSFLVFPEVPLDFLDLEVHWVLLTLVALCYRAALVFPSSQQGLENLVLLFLPFYQGYLMMDEW